MTAAAAAVTAATCDAARDRRQICIINIHADSGLSASHIYTTHVHSGNVGSRMHVAGYFVFMQVLCGVDTTLILQALALSKRTRVLTSIMRAWIRDALPENKTHHHNDHHLFFRRCGTT